MAIRGVAREEGPADTLDASQLMRLHAAALFTHDAAGRLLAVNEAVGAVAPKFFFGRTPDGNFWSFRYDVDSGLADDLASVCEAQHTGLRVEPDTAELEPLIARLSVEEPVSHLWAGPAFTVPAASMISTAVRVTADNVDVLSPYLEAWSEDVSAGAPVVAVLEGGKAVSLCASVRITARAHEAGVETHPEFRGRGYASRAVSAWANVVRESGSLPLYSTSWSNEPSRVLARKLKLVQFGTTFHVG